MECQLSQLNVSHKSKINVNVCVCVCVRARTGVARGAQGPCPLLIGELKKQKEGGERGGGKEREKGKCFSETNSLGKE